MERRGGSVTLIELQEKVAVLLADEEIPYSLRRAMARAAVVAHDDGGATTDMIRRNWQSTPVAKDITLHVMDDGRVFLEVTDNEGTRRSFSYLPPDTLGHSLAHEEWLPLDQI